MCVCRELYVCSTTGSDVRLRALLHAYELDVYALISTPTQKYASEVVGDISLRVMLQCERTCTCNIARRCAYVENL